MTEEQLKKSVEEIVNGIMTKAMPENAEANGGQDKIHSGSPMTEEQKAEEAKKAAAAEAESKEKDESKEEEQEEAKKAKKGMKKSISELADVLDEEELELIKAWREEEQKEEQITKAQPAQEDLAKALTKAVTDAVAPLKKAMEDKDSLIKSLSDKVEKMASQPAYDRRSISNLETVEKSGAATQELSKSQITDKMLGMQIAGKGVTSHHIAEFEATGNISDPLVKSLVFKELKI